MLLQITFALISILVFVNSGGSCPNGGTIYKQGVSKEGIADIIKYHNKFRLDIANGRVLNQPKGINLKKMKYDKTLGDKAEAVSNTCKMNHVKIKDSRFPWVGQNLYIAYSSKKNTKQEWRTAIQNWFDENKYFRYPDKILNGEVVGHYTQVVWANSSHVGCDFIAFLDPEKKSIPYGRLYTCNYGPGGNQIGIAPYKKGTSGCSNLC